MEIVVTVEVPEPWRVRSLHEVAGAAYIKGNVCATRAPFDGAHSRRKILRLYNQ